MEITEAPEIPASEEGKQSQKENEIRSWIELLRDRLLLGCTSLPRYLATFQIDSSGCPPDVFNFRFDSFYFFLVSSSLSSYAPCRR